MACIVYAMAVGVYLKECHCLPLTRYVLDTFAVVRCRRCAIDKAAPRAVRLRRRANAPRLPSLPPKTLSPRV